LILSSSLDAVRILVGGVQRILVGEYGADVLQRDGARRTPWECRHAGEAFHFAGS
jgi:hypothetical protein